MAGLLNLIDEESSALKPKKALMSNDEAKLLKLGDYVIRSVKNQSDTYYMVTGIEDDFKLRKVGNHELLVIEDINEFENFTKIDTTRD